MHEPFEPKCSFCAKFVRCFADDSPLADWGRCADRYPGAINQQGLAELEEEARGGNYRRLLEKASALGLYQETDDGCERFVPRSAPPAARRPGAAST